MKHIITYILLLTFSLCYAQEAYHKKQAKLEKQANNLISEANTLVGVNNFVFAEAEYRKAISKQPTSIAGTYNLAHSYYTKGNLEEALFRNEQAAKNATDKAEKHKIYHNMGNALIQSKQCRKAVEAFKNALRNNPKDEETRYNLAMAKECAKNEQDDPQEENKDGENERDKKESEDDKKKEEEEKEDKENKDEKGDEEKDKKEGDDKEENGESDKKDKKDGEGDDKEKEQQKPKQKPGQLSSQQIRNLLEAMDNQEQKVQEKMNAKKAKGVRVKTDKDW